MRPLQPIKDGRFEANAIVEYLLDKGPFDMNHLGTLGFSQEDREQFAQLIGYSLSGFSELSYVRNETYDAAMRMTTPGMNEADARNVHLRETLDNVRDSVKGLATTLFRIHPDDLIV
jgi:hypothetical protein